MDSYRKEFAELDRKVRRYMRLIKQGILDEETTQIYYQQIDKWHDRMRRIAAVIKV